MPAAEVLQFDATAHRYTLGGRHLPSVTQVLDVLALYEGVSLEVLRRAQEFGTHVHLATELDDRGVLDLDALDPALLPYLRAWRKFRRDSGFAIAAIEERVVHERHGYAGTLDRRGVYKRRPTIVDIKTCLAPRSVGAQVAAYDAALRAMRGESIAYQRLCVELRPNDYRVHQLRDPADWPLFLSCLNVTLWKNNYASRPRD